MTKVLLVFLALSVFVVHCNVAKEKQKGPEIPKEPGHKREKRSCHECDNVKFHGPPPPPPPPLPRPFFDLTKNTYGSLQGAFSAADAGAQAGGAYSRATASASSSAGSHASGNYGSQSTGYQKQANANGMSSTNTQLNTDGQNGIGFGGQKKSGAFGNYKENHYSYQSGGNKHFEQQSGSPGAGFVGLKQTNNGARGVGVQGGFENARSKTVSSAQTHGSEFSGNGQQQTLSGQSGFESARSKTVSSAQTHDSGSGFSGNGQQQILSGQSGFESARRQTVSSAQTHSSGSGFSGKGQRFQSDQSGFDDGHKHDQNQMYGSQRGDNRQQVQSVGSGAWQKVGYDSNSNVGSSVYNGNSSGKEKSGGSTDVGLGVTGHGAGANSGQEELSESLQSASKGLQTKQSVCSTCGKTGFSQSNAKSHSGNAVAISVNG